jgi:hypothetical protein
LKRRILIFTVSSYTVFGITPPSANNQTFQLNDQNFQYSQPDFQGRLFSTEELPSMTFGANVTFDYTLQTVTNRTSLAGQTILVDDSSNEFQWHGSWEEKPTNISDLLEILSVQRNKTALETSRVVTFAAHGNGTHQTSTEGDSFTFQFAGKSLLFFHSIFLSLTKN